MNNCIEITYCCKTCGGKISKSSALDRGGNCKSCAVSGRNNPNFQGGQIQVNCKVCNSNIFRDKNQTIDKKFYICGENCRSLYASQVFLGKNNPNYGNKLSLEQRLQISKSLGGNGFILNNRDKYPIIFNNKLKLEIRTRDNFECQGCGLKEENHFIGKKIYKLAIHHIDYNKENCNKSNLITLCNSCNTKANSNRDYWFAYYTYKMEEK